MTFELVLSHLRKRDFAVLSTIGKGGRPHSVGVNYGVSEPGRAFVTEYLAGRPFDETASVVSPATDHPVAWLSPDRGLD